MLQLAKVNHYYLIQQIKMFYTKSPSKTPRKEEEIQPWNAEESNMLNLIIESAEVHSKLSKNIDNHLPQYEKISSVIHNKQPHSYNFCSNLRKYQKKKAEEFNSKRDVNFIEKNIKGVSEDFMYFNEDIPAALAHKMAQDKHKKGKMLEQQLNATIEPVNWSLIMYYEESKGERKHRHKDIQSFLRFQSQKMEKNSLRKQSFDLKGDNIEENSKSEGNKYQKLLKLREGLRKRNLKSASESRKIFDNSLSIEQNNRSPKARDNSMNNNTLTRILPKTSQSLRNTDTTIKIQNSPQTSPKKQQSFDPRIIYTSHRNRISNSKKKSIETSRLRHR